MAGRYTCEGDIGILTKFEQWFSSDPQAAEKATAQPDPPPGTGARSDKCNCPTCQGLIIGMPTVFNAEAAGDLIADISFKVTGAEPGEPTLHIENGKCTYREGLAASPTLTIETPSDVWIAISRGELDGQQAFMQGKYKAFGNFVLMMKFSKLFGSA
jgi:putative sterol carrier protein